MDEENRVYRRLTVNCPARCAFSESDSEYFSIKVIDIGPEGIGFTAQKRLASGTNVYIDIDLGNGEQPRLAAEIMWVEEIKWSGEFRVGAKIFDVKKEDLEKFVRFYCEQLIPTKRAKKKILIIEDERTMSDLLKLELTQSGYDVVCAYDGESGFSKYMEERPDLIILDIMLPKLNGYEVCRKIRRGQEDSRTPILMLTAKNEDADRIVGGVIGAQKYLTKPFEAEHLLGEIKELLNSSKV